MSNHSLLDVLPESWSEIGAVFSRVFYLLWCLHFLFACVVGAPTIVAADAEAAAAVFA